MMSRLKLPILDGFGLDADIELTFRRDVVEVHHESRCRAVFDRDQLREWLTYPEGDLTADDVSFILSTDGILLRIEPGIPSSPLSRAALYGLRNHA